jgi:hypothetical protein
MPIPGDFNGDGVVNNDDYLIWVQGAPIGNNTPIIIGASAPHGDADLDGDIDFDDLKIWLQNANPQLLPGDYNHNGKVDAADYTVWRDTLGSTTSLSADGDQNGVVGQSDYDLWKGLFGEIPGGAAGSAINTLSVPEPPTFPLFALAISAGAATRLSNRLDANRRRTLSCR